MVARGEARLGLRALVAATCCIAALAAVPAGARGDWTAAEPLSESARDAWAPAAAATPGGPALVAWSSPDATSNRVQAAQAASGTDFRSPLTLSTGDSAFAPTAAIDADGDAAVAWQQKDGAASRIMVSTGSDANFGAPVAVSPAGAHAFHPELSVASDGTIVVVWHVMRGPDQVVQ